MKQEDFLVRKKTASLADLQEAVFACPGTVEKPRAVSGPADRPAAAFGDAGYEDAPRSARQACSAASQAAIRALDWVAAALLLIFMLPLIVILAILVMVLDPGPAIFAHKRIGRGGRPFYCLKFRSMYVGAEERLASMLAQDPALRLQWQRDQKLRDDPRITPFGRLLRVTSLDELPQLFNVMRGDMSLVGPRPIVADEIPRFGRFIDHYYMVRPGLTGLWQITGRSNTTYQRRVATDVLYARRQSVGLNARILAATVPAVVLRRGSF